MSEHQNIYAYTPPGYEPPYLAINLEEKGSYTVHVRGPKAAPEDTTQPHASIDLGSKYEIVNMFLALGDHLYGSDVMAITGKVIYHLLTEASKADIEAAADNAVVIADELSEQQ